EPVPAVLFVVANPLYLVYLLGGFHNDVLLLAPVLGAVSLLLARRERRAAAAFVIAVGIKASAFVLAPFLLIGAARRWRFATTAVGAAALFAALSVASFGWRAPNLADQS